MKNHLESLSETARWRLLVDAAKQAAEAEGYTLARIPGRGLSNVWNMEKSGKTQSAAIRTTRDRWIAFPPLDDGKKWKTLDDVDLVLVAAVDSRENPQKIEVYIFPAKEVRQHFDAAYAARVKASHVIRNNYGMWVGLDPDNRAIASSVGSGIVAKHKPIASYSIEDLMSAVSPAPKDKEEMEAEALRPETLQPATIAEVMAWARERVAELAGVRVEAVKLDLKLEY